MYKTLIAFLNLLINPKLFLCIYNFFTYIKMLNIIKIAKTAKKKKKKKSRERYVFLKKKKRKKVVIRL